jgi:transmembrane sensor
MNSLSRIKRWLGSKSDVAQNDAGFLLQRTLDAEVRSARSADPETARQWQRLSATLERGGMAIRPRRSSPRLRFVLAGASVAGAAMVLIVASVLLTREPSVTTYRTARGEQSTVVLGDSTRVMLNHTSQIAVTSDGGDRLVTLRGEAFFRVRKTGQPFIVSTDVGRVEVLGTEFNVRVREDRLEVAVLGGSVRLSARIGGKDSAVVLAPGQISFCARGSLPTPPENLLFAEYPGWLYGKLLFTKTTLSSACSEIESKYDVIVRIENPRLQSETITGAIDARSAETAIATIARLTGSAYRHEKNSYILY